MRVLLGVVLLGGCLQTNTVTCGDGTVCPRGTACVTVSPDHDHGPDMQKLCVAPDQVTACAGQAALATCSALGVATGRCYDGVCLAAGCGNGRVDPGEVCDDGNAVVGDGCSDACLSNETCGNGFLDPLRIDAAGHSVANEACDDANLVGHDACTSGCRPELATWADVTPARFGSRGSIHAVLDPVRGRIVLFGGQFSIFVGSVASAPHDLGDTWESDGTTWAHVATRIAPTPRGGDAIAYDGARRRVVLFGGSDGAARADTWTWDGLTWTEHHPAVSPPARGDHAMAYDARRKVVVLFGGSADAAGNGPLADTWEWDGGTWHEVVTANAPSPRFGHALAYDATRGTIVLAAGMSIDSALDTWTYDGSTWTRVDSTTTPDIHSMGYDAASGRIIAYADSVSSTFAWTGTAWTDLGHGEPLGGSGSYHDYTTTVDPAGRVVLLGGVRRTCVRLACSGGDTDDVWRWDDASGWTAAPATPTPGHLRDAAFAFDPTRGRIVAVGGIDDDTTTYLGDTWEFDGMTWQQFSNQPGAVVRAFAAMAYDAKRDELVLFGGADGTPTTSNDTWVRQDRTWIQRTPATAPPPRFQPAMAYDPIRDRVVLFGGLLASDNVAVDETWAWDGTTWTILHPAHAPSARSQASMTYDPIAQKLVLFGGSAGDMVTPRPSDTWTWDGTDWTPAVTETSPPPRVAAAMVWDAGRRRVVLLGGAGSGLFDDAWEWDGAAWSFVDPPVLPPARSSAIAAPMIDGAGVYVFGGLGSLGDAWRLRWDAPLGYEQCALHVDDDGDGKSGCDDRDCWATCTPLCPPGATCDPAAPHCGDHVCGARETCRSCPEDCATCADTRCGDTLCDPGETAASCPGDCAP